MKYIKISIVILIMVFAAGYVVAQTNGGTGGVEIVEILGGIFGGADSRTTGIRWPVNMDNVPKTIKVDVNSAYLSRFGPLGYGWMFGTAAVSGSKICRGSEGEFCKTYEKNTDTLMMKRSVSGTTTTIETKR